jgi:hypothetical protein
MRLRCAYEEFSDFIAARPSDEVGQGAPFDAAKTQRGVTISLVALVQ